MPSLNDRVVLLTGGATGIGRAIALDMAAAGATVAIGDTNVDGGQRTVEEILSAGGRASFSAHKRVHLVLWCGHCSRGSHCIFHVRCLYVEVGELRFKFIHY